MQEESPEFVVASLQEAYNNLSRMLNEEIDECEEGSQESLHSSLFSINVMITAHHLMNTAKYLKENSKSATRAVSASAIRDEVECMAECALRSARAEALHKASTQGRVQRKLTALMERSSALENVSIVHSVTTRAMAVPVENDSDSDSDSDDDDDDEGVRGTMTEGIKVDTKRFTFDKEISQRTASAPFPSGGSAESSSPSPSTVVGKKSRVTATHEETFKAMSSQMRAPYVEDDGVYDTFDSNNFDPLKVSDFFCLDGDDTPNTTTATSITVAATGMSPRYGKEPDGAANSKGGANAPEDNPIVSCRASTMGMGDVAVATQAQQWMPGALSAANSTTGGAGSSVASHFPVANRQPEERFYPHMFVRSEEERQARYDTTRRLPTLRDLLRRFGRDDYGMIDFAESIEQMMTAPTAPVMWKAKIYAIMPVESSRNEVSSRRVLILESPEYSKSAKAKRVALYKAVQWLFPDEFELYVSLNRSDSANPDPEGSSVEAVLAASAGMTPIPVVTEASMGTQVGLGFQRFTFGGSSKPLLWQAFDILTRNSGGAWTHLTWRAERRAKSVERANIGYYTAQIVNQNGVEVGACAVAAERLPLLCAVYIALYRAAAKCGELVVQLIKELFVQFESMSPPTMNVARQYVMYMFDAFFGIADKVVCNSSIVTAEREEGPVWHSTVTLQLITDYENPLIPPKPINLATAQGRSKKAAMTEAIHRSGKENFFALFTRLGTKSEDNQRGVSQDVLSASYVLKYDWPMHRDIYEIAGDQLEKLFELEELLCIKYSLHLRVEYAEVIEKHDNGRQNQKKEYRFIVSIIDVQTSEETVTFKKKGATRQDALLKATNKAIKALSEATVPK